MGNAEIARGFLAALNTGDKSEWDSVCDPEIEWTPPADWPEAGTIRGADAVWDFFVELNEPWEQGDYEIAEIINPADNKIAVLISREMRGKASGVIAEFAYWTIATFRDGRICRVQWFSRRDEAMEAAGA